MKDNSGDVSKNRLFRFLKEVVSAESSKIISQQLKIGSKDVSDYLEGQAWMTGMSDNLYEAFKGFINSSYHG